MKKSIYFLLSLTLILCSCDLSNAIPFEELPNPQQYILEIPDLPDVGEPWETMSSPVYDEQTTEGSSGYKTANSSNWATRFSSSLTGGQSDSFVYVIASRVTFYETPISYQPTPPETVGEYGNVSWKVVAPAPAFGDVSGVWRADLVYDAGTILPAYWLEFVKGHTDIVVYTTGMPDGVAESAIFDLAEKIESRLPDQVIGN